ncbi:MAG: helix-turn-helix transcriptional regulator [Flavobacteriales bacterium]|nr:helix-turn-helix transcriptional regulator [Flavobacteriales bacterium]MCB9364673.1 helix-turn-helix transcriptional regulator [Flavobacteriales bacterium]
MEIDSNKYLIFLGKRISDVRTSKEITQYRLAKNLMMEQSNLARIEKGETNPTIKTLLKICEVLDISLEELIKGFHI